jgi:hypothetical protein
MQRLSAWRAVLLKTGALLPRKTTRVEGNFIHNIMKKVFFIAIAISVASLVCNSCAETAAFMQGYGQGYSQGSEGRRVIGTASSESQCKSMAANAGCSNTYAFYSNTGNCFCK